MSFCRIRVGSGSLLSAQWAAKKPNILHADSDDSDQTADAQTDPSLYYMGAHAVWLVCREVAYLCLVPRKREHRQTV